MPACCDPPNRPPPELIDRLIDEIAWAKTCLLVAAATPPGSPAREAEMEKLRAAVAVPRRLVDEVLSKAQDLPRHIFIELRTCELAIPRLEAGAVLRQNRQDGSP